MANLLFDRFGFGQMIQFFANQIWTTQLNPNKQNRRSAVKCYFTLFSKWVVSFWTHGSMRTYSRETKNFAFDNPCLPISAYNWLRQQGPKIQWLWHVGRAVASNSRGPRFESTHRQHFLTNIYCQLYWKDVNKESGREWPFFLKKST